MPSEKTYPKIIHYFWDLSADNSETQTGDGMKLFLLPPRSMQQPEWHVMTVPDGDIAFFRCGEMVKGQERWVVMGADDAIIARNLRRWPPEPIFATKIQDRDLWQAYPNPEDPDQSFAIGRTQNSILSMIEYVTNVMIVPENGTFADKRTIFGRIFCIFRIQHNPDGM